MVYIKKKQDDTKGHRAPPGNKYALGNDGGRPPKYDPFVEAYELLKYAELPTTTAIRMFGPFRGYPPQRMDDWYQNNPVFRDAYDIALEIIGTRREQKLILAGSPAPYNKTAGYYNPHFNSYERNEKIFDSKLRLEEQKVVDATIIQKQLDILQQLKEERQERKIANTNANDDHKS